MHSRFFTSCTQVDRSCNCAIMGYVTFQMDHARSRRRECVLVMGPVSRYSVHGAECVFRHRQEWPIETHDAQAIQVQKTQTHSVQGTQIQADKTTQQRQTVEVGHETALS